MASLEFTPAPAPGPGRTRVAVNGPLALVMALVMALTLVLTACGASTTGSSGTDVPSGTGKLEGLQRNPPLQVGTVTLPAVKPGQPDQPFPMRAQPGELLAVYFGYTSCPDLCPTTLSDLRKALKQLGDDARRIDTAFVTVDPQRDTPEVLDMYLSSFLTRYHALRTEDPAALRAAEEPFLASSTITPRADGTYDVSHTAVTALVDKNGTVVLEWPFGVSPETMANDLAILLRQSSNKE
jgi:protein SCO1